MDALKVISGTVLRHRHQVDRPIGSMSAVNYRRARYPNLRSNLAAETVVTGSFTRCQHRDLPELRSVISIQGVDAVVLGHNVKDIVNSLARNINFRQIEGLGVDLGVDWIEAEFAKCR